VLAISDLTKVYRGGLRANQEISLSVAPGRVFGLLGHNGAGKTTLVSQVVGLLRPTSGTIEIDGRDAVADPAFARRACAIQPQAQVPISGLTPRQAIELVGRVRGGRTDEVRARAARFVEALDIGEWSDVAGERLSAGVKRLASFCMTAVVPGRIVILDEPTNDVDPVRRRLLWAQVRALADDGAAVVLVTHNVLEAERAVDRLAVLDHGRVIAEGTPAELKSRIADELRLELVLEPDATLGDVPPFVRGTVATGRRVLVTIGPDEAGPAVRWAGELRAERRVEEFALGPATLEDAYVRLVDSAQAARRSDAA
jgi:ABC-2 type transport system ATP-binding protein